MPKLAAPAARALVLALPSARPAAEKEARRAMPVPAVEESAAVPKTRDVMALVDAVERVRQPRVNVVVRPAHLRLSRLMVTASAAAVEALLLMLPKDC